MKLNTLLFVCGLLSLQSVGANNSTDPQRPLTQAAFSQWLVTLSGEFEQKGISLATLERDLLPLQLNQKVIELDRKQPEFNQNFWNYYTRRVTQQRIQKGQEVLKQHQPLFDQVARIYGLPASVLTAFWGLETNFGGYTGNLPILQSLATLAYDTRRTDFFKSQLFQALKIIDQGHVSAAEMKGSWAGAMGQTQFMPSTFLKYAVDGDGDKKIHLWNSLSDVMHSSGNFLSQIGWQRGETWGVEVRIPPTLDYSHLDEIKLLGHWWTLGVNPLDAGQEDQLDPNTSAQLILPLGHQGPAFLVFDNFKVIMRWNRSIFYALSVGLLADQIAGKPGISRLPQKIDAPLSLQKAMAVQEKLNQLGFKAGKPDGLIGPETQRALRAWQASQGLIADGHPSSEHIDLLLNSGS